MYRNRNGAALRGLLGQNGGAPLDIALWALDRPHPALERYTVGSGPGGKFELLNAILAERPVNPGSPLLIVDDDVVLVHGSLARLLRIVERAGLGLAQPAHTSYSLWTHHVTAHQPLSRARLTNFVEIGPVVAVSPEWVNVVTPFPADLGMGWGLDFEWMKLAGQGCRLGVVDAVRMVHFGPLSQAYDTTVELERLRVTLGTMGITGGHDVRKVVDDLLQTYEGWRPWQGEPPWDATR